MGLFWLLVGGGGFILCGSGLWWLIVDLFWVVLGGGGYFCGGSRWWWVGVNGGESW